MMLSQDDLDELIVLADAGAAELGGNEGWRFPDTALGRAVVELMGRVPTRIEVVAAQRRHEEAAEERACDEWKQA